MNKSTISIVLGAIIAALSFLFFAALILLSIFGKTVPCDQRYLVVIFLSIGLGLSASILAGNLGIEGAIKLLWVKENPIKFSAASGFALIVFIFTVGHYLYVERAECKFSTADSIISSYINEAKDVERDWLDTVGNPFQCNQLPSRINKVLQKLQSASIDNASLKAQIRRQFISARLNFFAATVSKEPSVASENISRAEILLADAIALGENLKAQSSEHKEDYDWYFDSQYDGKILANQIFFDIKKYALSNDRAYLSKATIRYERLKNAYSDLLAKASPLEMEYWAVIKSAGKTNIKPNCAD